MIIKREYIGGDGRHTVCYTNNEYVYDEYVEHEKTGQDCYYMSECQTTPKSPKIIMMDKIMYNKITGYIYIYIYINSNGQPCTYLLLVHTKEREGMTTSHMHTQIHDWIRSYHHHPLVGGCTVPIYYTRWLFTSQLMYCHCQTGQCADD